MLPSLHSLSISGPGDVGGGFMEALAGIIPGQSSTPSTVKGWEEKIQDLKTKHAQLEERKEKIDIMINSLEGELSDSISSGRDKVELDEQGATLRDAKTERLMLESEIEENDRKQRFARIQLREMKENAKGTLTAADQR